MRAHNRFLSQMRATFRALELSPDLARTGNSPINLNNAEVSRNVMESLQQPTSASGEASASTTAATPSTSTAPTTPMALTATPTTTPQMPISTATPTTLTPTDLAASPTPTALTATPATLTATLPTPSTPNRSLNNTRGELRALLERLEHELRTRRESFGQCLISIKQTSPTKKKYLLRQGHSLNICTYSLLKLVIVALKYG